MATQPAGSNNQIPLRLANKYVMDMQISVASNTTLTIQAGVCRDSTNQDDIAVQALTTLNFANIGVVNGIDTGAIGASSLYYIFAIGKSLDPNGLVVPAGYIASLSSTPLLPKGYDLFRRIGWARTGAGSTLLTMYQSGNGITREYFFDTMIQVLTSGAAQTLTSFSLAAAAPPLDNMAVYLEVGFTPNTAGDSVSFAPFGSTATVIPSVSGVVSAKAQNAQIKLLSKLNTATPSLLYINSAASGSTNAWLFGFQDTL